MHKFDGDKFALKSCLADRDINVEDFDVEVVEQGGSNNVIKSIKKCASTSIFRCRYIRKSPIQPSLSYTDEKQEVDHPICRPEMDLTKRSAIAEDGTYSFRHAFIKRSPLQPSSYTNESELG